MDKIKKIWTGFGKYVIIGIIIVISIVLLYFSMKQSMSSYFQDILDRQLEQYRAEYALNIEEKEKEIRDKDKQLIVLSDKLKKSQLAYNKLQEDIENLKKEIDDVKEPESLQETKDRLKALGYNPY